MEHSLGDIGSHRALYKGRSSRAADSWRHNPEAQAQLRQAIRAVLEQHYEKHLEVGASLCAGSPSSAGLGWATEAALCSATRPLMAPLCHGWLFLPSFGPGARPQIPFIAQYRKEVCGELLAVRSRDEPQGLDGDAATGIPAGTIRVRATARLRVQ